MNLDDPKRLFINLLYKILGNTNIDFSLFPSEDTQRKWIKAYLKEKYQLTGM